MSADSVFSSFANDYLLLLSLLSTTSQQYVYILLLLLLLLLLSALLKLFIIWILQALYCPQNQYHL